MVEGQPVQVRAFRANAGQLVTIDLISASFDSYLRVLGPGLRTLAETVSIPVSRSRSRRMVCTESSPHHLAETPEYSLFQYAELFAFPCRDPLRGRARRVLDGIP